MCRFDQNSVASAILNAPGWARVGITAPNSCMREDAARELARSILDLSEAGASNNAEGQARLPLQSR
jgi:DNA-binding IclR family transcriptional regulator